MGSSGECGLRKDPYIFSRPSDLLGIQLLAAAVQRVPRGVKVVRLNPFLLGEAQAAVHGDGILGTDLHNSKWPTFNTLHLVHQYIRIKLQ